MYSLFIYNMLVSAQEYAIQASFWIGVFVVLYYAILILIWLIGLVKIPYNLIERYGKNSWAVVTGATDGIGRGFCDELAKKGFNVCLISRSKEKLEIVIDQLKKINDKVQYKYVVADFRESAEDNFFDVIIDQIKDLDLSILVNNVGVASGGTLTVAQPQDLRDQLTINLFPLTMLTKKIIPLFLNRKENAKRVKAGAVVNISSFGGEFPCGGRATYSATKKYSEFFTRALEVEYEGKIDFMCVKCMIVSTPATNHIKGSGSITQNQCAQGSLKDLGHCSVTFGHWYHKLQAYSAKLFNFVVGEDYFLKIMYNTNLKVELQLQKKKLEEIQAKQSKQSLKEPIQQ